MRNTFALFVLPVLVWLAGCSAIQTRAEFSFYHPPADGESFVWPAGESQPGRVRYLGELVGEQNIVSDTASAFVSSGQRWLKKLVGLGRHNKERVILQRPQSGVVDNSGNIYVTDVSRQAVYRFSPFEKKLDVWEYAEKGVRFVSPIGIVVTAEGDIWVADSYLGFIAHLDADGEPLPGIGKGALVRPTGLALDQGKQRLFVSDTAEHNIKVLDYNGNIIQTIGEFGEGQKQLNGPTHLALQADRLYVTDTLNARVQIFSENGDWLGGFGQRGLYLGEMTRPKGIAVDRHENIYVVESFYDYLLIFDTQGKFLLPIGGSGKDVGQFYLPAGVWIDEHDRIYVADMFNGRVVVFQLLDQDIR